jgi:hypothetical protein
MEPARARRWRMIANDRGQWLWSDRPVLRRTTIKVQSMEYMYINT